MKKLYFFSRLKSSEKIGISPGWFSKIRSKSIVILLLFTLGFSQVGWGQEIGDYRSKQTGDWNVAGNWEYYNGTTWEIATNYPGITAGDKTVTIESGHVITIPIGFTTPLCFGDLIVYGQLTLNTTFRLDCTYFVLVDGGTILWPENNVEFYLPLNSAIRVQNYDTINKDNGLQGSPCSNTQKLFIGGFSYAVCKGTGNSQYTFENINLQGGTLQAYASANPDKICVGNTVTLSGETDGLVVGNLSVEWTGTGPNGYTFSSTLEDPGEVGPLNNAGLYTFTFTASDDSYNISDEVQVTVVPTSLTWDGNTNVDWNTADNWNPDFVPIHCTDVTIPNTTNSPVVSIADAACNNLTIEADGELTIALGGTLTTNGDVTINSTSAVTNGSLIVNGALAAGGTVTYNRHLATTRWWIASAPLNGANLSQFSSKISTYNNTWDFAPYVEADNAGWNYLPSATTDHTLNSGQGYLTGTTGDGIIPFTGTLNGDFTIPVTNTPTGTEYRNGWNALGNPYTSAIGITTEAGTTEQFLAKNAEILETSYAAIYVWNETGTYDNNEQYYKAISNNGYTSYSYPGMGTLTDDHVQVGQGFLINAGGTGGDIQFTKAMQTHLPTLSLKSAKTSWPGVTLLAENGNQSRYTIVTFNEKMTAGLDKTYDAGLLASSDFILYSRLVSGDEGVDFEIQCLPDNMYSELSVPIGLDMPKAGTVTFKAAGIILPNGIYPVLEDKLLQVTTPLKTEADSYTVNIEDAMEGIGRFYMIFTNTVSAKETAQPESFTAWFANDKIVLDGYAEKGTRVSLFDMSGRKFGIYPLMQMNRNEIPASTLSPGIYLLRIEGPEQQQEIKIPVSY